MPIDKEARDSNNSMDCKEAEEYTELFLKFCSWMEPVLRKAVIVTLVGLCVLQIFLRIPALRGFIALTDRFEGVAVDRLEGR
ncbi:hypothetical protein ACE3MQ_09485 [Paenibacillus lentus]|uniref:hypothetical protein n=1 Tax=Paenibacillus lentus TaxID=1338368 RepID=UPI003657BF19